MKIQAAALFLALSMWSSAIVVVQAFAPPSSSSLSSSSIVASVARRERHLHPPTTVASTLDKTKTSESSSSTSLPPERIAPEAGYSPPFENRYNPRTPSEFMNSDTYAPNAGEVMYECPLTLWNSDNIDIYEAQRLAKTMISPPAARRSSCCPYEIYATPTDNEMGLQYFITNKETIRADLVNYGAIWFRNFNLMTTVKGNRDMYEALGLQPCLDPLHSSGLRKFASERDALYEEVGRL